jgi:Ca2+-transporting ATPase
MLKGASEILTKLCTNHVKVSPPEETRKDSDVETEPFTEDTRDNINRSIIFYANQSLRTIALCYKEYPADADLSEVELADLARDLSLIMIVGIEDPLREGVIEAVANCQKASIRVVMVTGDNVLTARSIAKQCGILTPGGLIMEGPTFRTVSRIRVLVCVVIVILTPSARRRRRRHQPPAHPPRTHRPHSVLADPRPFVPGRQATPRRDVQRVGRDRRCLW